MIALIGMAVIAMACFLLLTVLYSRNEKKERLRLEQTKADIADMALLFETMRSVITQQKHLAKEFNQELDKKVSQVKQILAQSMAKNERLYEQQQTLAKQLLEAKTDLQNLQQQLACLQDHPALAATSAPDSTITQTATLHKASPPPPPIHLERHAPETPTPPPPPPPPDTSVQSAFADWGGFETDDTPIQPPLKNKPVKSTAPPEDSENARAAFRALLDLIPAQQRSATMPPSNSPPPANTKISLSLQQRVTEYSDAGMSIPEIARELGVGKGEVRLMLSLARQKRM